MEISGWMIYLISIADGLYQMIGIIGWVGLIGLIILGVVKLFVLGNNDKDDFEEDGDCFDLLRKINKYLKICCIGFMFGALGTIFVPTAKGVAAIYLLPKIVNNETLKVEASEIYGLAKEWLKETVGEKHSKGAEKE